MAFQSCFLPWPSSYQPEISPTWYYYPVGEGDGNEILPRLDFWKPGFREYSGATAEFGILCERERSLGPLGFGVPLTVIGQLG